jgi:hypothetical protein
MLLELIEKNDISVLKDYIRTDISVLKNYIETGGDLYPKNNYVILDIIILNFIRHNEKIDYDILDLILSHKSTNVSFDDNRYITLIIIAIKCDRYYMYDVFKLFIEHPSFKFSSVLADDYNVIVQQIRQEKINMLL